MGQYVAFTTIEELPLKSKWKEHRVNEDDILPEKESAEPALQLEVWTESGFTKIDKIIRHKTDKRVYSVQTPSSYVTVTEDHSLLDKSANKVSPKDVKVGSQLLHSKSLPSYEVKDTVVSTMAYTLGAFLGGGSCFYEGNKGHWAIRSGDFEMLEKCHYELMHCYEHLSFAVTHMERCQKSGPFMLTVIFPKKGDVAFLKKMVGVHEFLTEWIETFYTNRGQKMVPTSVLNAPKKDIINFLKGYHDCRVECFGKCDVEGQITTAGIYYLYEKLGVHPRLKDAPNFWKTAKDLSLIRKNIPEKPWWLDDEGKATYVCNGF